MNWYLVLDSALLLLATLRLSRLVTTDNIPGQWWIYGPLYKKAFRRGSGHVPRWAKYMEGLGCPFCVGFWIGLLAVLSVLLWGPLGHMPDWWRWAAAPFAFNYVVGHVARNLD